MTSPATGRGLSHPAADAVQVQALHGSPSAYWATELPLPRPGMLFHGKRLHVDVYPFSAPNVQYVHFARNAIYMLAAQRGLAGREVLLPAYFHGVEVEALLAAGVKPRFYPVRAGMRVDPEDVLGALTPTTRAVYLIHYAGFPGPAAEIESICRSRGLYFIEDCALALLSKAGDRPLGSFGDAAIFCLYKTLPTPDGGAVVLREGELALGGEPPGGLGSARQAAAGVLTYLERSPNPLVRSAARGVKAVGKAATRGRDDGWVDVGTQNFNSGDASLLMSDVSRRIVAAQDFGAIVSARRRNYEALAQRLGDLSAPVFARLAPGVCPLFYPFVTEHKLELWRRLRGAGIQSVLFWYRTDVGPAAGRFPDVDRLRRTVLELPCHQDLTTDAICRIADVVRAAVRDLGAPAT